MESQFGTLEITEYQYEIKYNRNRIKKSSGLSSRIQVGRCFYYVLLYFIVFYYS
jgi:hypothetical protein